MNNFIYPDISNDDNFSEQLTKKAEFFIHRSSDNIEENKNKTFTPSSVQNIVKQFIHPRTPYNGIFLWHGVGVGKTCAALRIAEQFKKIIKNSFDNKMWILCQNVDIINNWKNELFNQVKEKKMKNETELNNTSEYNVQCIGNEYSQPVFENNNSTRDKKIKQNYNIITYGTFVSILEKIKNHCDNESKIYSFDKNNHFKETLKSIFSNSVIIVDEVHEIVPKVKHQNKKKQDVINLIKSISLKNNQKLELIFSLPNKTKKEKIIIDVKDNIIFINENKTTLELNDYVSWINIENIIINSNLYEVEINSNDDFIKNAKCIKVAVKNFGDDSKIELFSDKDRAGFSFALTADNKEWKNDETKKCYMFLKEIASSSIRLKMILLTATPMFDEVEEIIGLINLLRINDYLPELHTNEIFYNETVNMKKLIEASNGYISYMRGGHNPLEYPLKLYPQQNTYIFKEDENKIKFFETKLSEYQMQVYNAFNPNLSSSNRPALIDVCKAVFPGQLENMNKMKKKSYISQKKMFQKYFNKNDEGYYIFKEDDEFFRESSKYCPKLMAVYSEIINSTGIAFVYSELLEMGSILFSLFLKYNGFTHLKLNKNSKIKATGKNFIILNRPEDLRIYKQNYESKNTDGSFVKIIIGTRKVSQGITLLNIRQLHILEGWHNLSRLKQVTGRAIRRHSHHALEEQFRNVTVYYHISSFDENYYEKIFNSSYDKDRVKIESLTADEQRYLTAIRKYNKQIMVENNLADISIDCFLNQSQNNLQNIISSFNKDLKSKQRVVIDSKQIERTNYQVKVPFEITCNKTEESSLFLVDKSSYVLESDGTEIIQKIINEILPSLITLPVTMKDIIHKCSINQIPSDISENMIYYIIEMKIRVFDSNGTIGLLQLETHLDKKYVLFNPIWDENKKINDNMPLSYRNKKPFHKINTQEYNNIMTKEEVRIQNENIYNSIVENFNNNYQDDEESFDILQIYDVNDIKNIYPIFKLIQFMNNTTSEDYMNIILSKGIDRWKESIESFENWEMLKFVRYRYNFNENKIVCYKIKKSTTSDTLKIDSETYTRKTIINDIGEEKEEIFSSLESIPYTKKEIPSSFMVIGSRKPYKYKNLNIQFKFNIRTTPQNPGENIETLRNYQNVFTKLYTLYNKKNNEIDMSELNIKQIKMNIQILIILLSKRTGSGIYFINELDVIA